MCRMLFSENKSIYSLRRVKRSVVAADIAHQMQKKKYEEELAVWRQTDEKLAEVARQDIVNMLYFEHGWLCNLDSIPPPFACILLLTFAQILVDNSTTLGANIYQKLFSCYIEYYTRLASISQGTPPTLLLGCLTFVAVWA